MVTEVREGVREEVRAGERGGEAGCKRDWKQGVSDHLGGSWSGRVVSWRGAWCACLVLLPAGTCARIPPVPQAVLPWLRRISLDRSPPSASFACRSLTPSFLVPACTSLLLALAHTLVTLAPSPACTLLLLLTPACTPLTLTHPSLRTPRTPLLLNPACTPLLLHPCPHTPHRCTPLTPPCTTLPLPRRPREPWGEASE